MRTEADSIRSLQRYLAEVLPEPWDIRLTIEAGREPQRPYALIEQSAAAVTAGGPPRGQMVTIPFAVNAYLPKQESRGAADDAALLLRETLWQAFKAGPDLRRPTTDRIPLWCYAPREAIQRVTVRGATSGEWTLTLNGATTDPIAFDPDGAALQAALDAVAPGDTLVEKRATGIFDVHMTGDLAGTLVPLMDLDASALVGGSPAVSSVLEGAAAPWRTDRDWMRVASYQAQTLRDPAEPTLAQVAVDLRCTFARGLPLPFGQMLLQRISATIGSGG